MKIVIFTQLYHPETASITETSKLLAERGHSVTVMTGLPNAPAGKIFKGYGFFIKLREDLANVRVLRNWLIPRGKGSKIMMSLNYLSFVFFCSLGLWRLGLKRPDVIFVNQLSPITVALPAIFYKWFTGKPLVMWIHDLWPDSVIASGALKEGKLYRTIGKLVDFIYSNCDFFFPQSIAMMEVLSTRGIPKNKMVYLPNPIDPFFKPLKRSQVIKGVEKIPTGFKVMFAGGIGKAQDFKTILEAAAILKTDFSEIKFIIVGDGRDKNEAKSRVAKLGLLETVLFLGSHPVEMMPQFYSNADVMLVTLKDEPIYEVTVPLKVQTYMACGKPIICNVKGEASRVIEEANCGFTTEPENPKKLANAIKEAFYLKQKDLEQLGFNALHYFEKNFKREKLIQTLEDNISRVYLEKVKSGKA